MQLICGDCLEILKTLPDESVDAVITDIPYGITNAFKDKWDSLDIGIDALSLCFEKVKIKGAVITFCTSRVLASLISKYSDYFKYDLVWSKTRATGHFDCNHRPLRNHEMIAVFCKNGYPNYTAQKYDLGIPYYIKPKIRKSSVYGKDNGSFSKSNGDRYPVSVLSFKPDKDMTTSHSNRDHRHPTQKPLSAMEWLVKSYSKENDLILDPFMGSGTTGLACKKLNREFIGIELMPEYFEIAQQRINDWQPPQQQELWNT